MAADGGERGDGRRARRPGTAGQCPVWCVTWGPLLFFLLIAQGQVARRTTGLFSGMAPGVGASLGATAAFASTDSYKLSQRLHGPSVSVRETPSWAQNPQTTQGHKPRVPSCFICSLPKIPRRQWLPCGARQSKQAQSCLTPTHARSHCREQQGQVKRTRINNSGVTRGFVLPKAWQGAIDTRIF